MSTIIFKEWFLRMCLRRLLTFVTEKGGQSEQRWTFKGCVTQQDDLGRCLEEIVFGGRTGGQRYNHILAQWDHCPWWHCTVRPLPVMALHYGTTPCDSISVGPLPMTALHCGATPRDRFACCGTTPRDCTVLQDHSLWLHCTRGPLPVIALLRDHSTWWHCTETTHSLWLALHCGTTPRDVIAR